METNYYRPAEDSRLLLDSIFNSFSFIENKKICEIGVGSGYVIKNIALEFPNNKFYGVDINDTALKITKEEFKNINKKINLKKSDMFDGFKKEKFDLIFFNTPYLPLEEGEGYDDLSDFDKAIYGGESGYEIIEKFILELNDRMYSSSHVFILFSSLSLKDKVEEIFDRNLFEFKYVGELSFAFEKLFVVKIEKSKILKSISLCGVNNMKYFDKGKHSLVFQGKFIRKNVIIKVGDFEFIQKEGIFLEKLSLEDFVPKIYVKENEFVVREMIEGIVISDFLEKEFDVKKIVRVFNKVFDICFRLDELGINKFEMTNPYKHIFIKGRKIKMIDFERCIYTRNPKNTTQFLQYVRRNINLLKKKGLEISSEKIYDFSKKFKEKKFYFRFEDLVDSFVDS